MTPLAAAVAIIGATLTAVGVIVGAIVKNSRRSPETRQALDSGWDKLTGGLERRIAALESADAAKDAEIVALTQRVKVAEDDAAAARAEAHQVRRLFARFVRPLVEWIDAGAQPPPPVIAPELRALLADAEADELL